MYWSQLSRQTVVEKVSRMTSDPHAQNLVTRYNLSIVNIAWEDSARYNMASWGPCISDLTLQINNVKMPVIRQPNFRDTTQNVPIDKITLVVGNELSGLPNKMITLKEYLINFNNYMTKKPIGRGFQMFRGPQINLYSQIDSHVIVSKQACLLPIEQSKETKFNVTLYNYQSRKQDPAVLVIVSTNKGTSAQIVEGNEQILLFNENGRKAEFIAQRLSDNLIQHSASVEGLVSQHEKPDNLISIIQIPLKQKYNMPNPWGFSGNNGFGMGQPQQFHNFQSQSSIENAIIKVASKMEPACKCGTDLSKMQARFAYNGSQVNCDICGIQIYPTYICYHCPTGRTSYHQQGYDMCQTCAEKQLEWDELNGLNLIERDHRFPIRVTLQYYKATSNGIINDQIMNDIVNQLSPNIQSEFDTLTPLVSQISLNPQPQPPQSQPNPFDPIPPSSSVSDEGYVRIREILEELKIVQYLSEFKAQEVGDDDLEFLTEEDLRSLIKKVGPRSRFRNKLQTIKTQKS